VFGNKFKKCTPATYLWHKGVHFYFGGVHTFWRLNRVLLDAIPRTQHVEQPQRCLLLKGCHIDIMNVRINGKYSV